MYSILIGYLHTNLLRFYNTENVKVFMCLIVKYTVVTVGMELSILYFKEFPKICINLPEDSFCLGKQCRPR